MAQVLIERDRCKGCELCLTACPQKVLGISKELNGRGSFFALLSRPRHCIGCCMCAIACPEAAIEVRVSGTLYHYFAY